ncbi:substrate-binding domain-containing protein, partial [Stigmatella aurantiaca]|uniref:substrate-binding domain-containing protein n=1 Tax=Stigmatella aurantiaca TaxID=41 RepID=UPI003B28194D
MLREAGLDPRVVHQRAALLASHRDVACAVARGEADVGLASRAWAARLGLSFRSLGHEAYGLVLPATCLGNPAVVGLCETAQGPAFKRSLQVLLHSPDEPHPFHLRPPSLFQAGPSHHLGLTEWKGGSSSMAERLDGDEALAD